MALPVRRDGDPGKMDFMLNGSAGYLCLILAEKISYLHLKESVIRRFRRSGFPWIRF
jgi:hypothetical protein